MRNFLFFTVLSLFVTNAFSAELVIPKLLTPVMDQAGILNADEVLRLDREIRALNDQGKAQITVFIPSSLQNYDIETFSIKVAEAWKLGDKEKDRGLLIVIAPNERSMRLEVGYGLEGSIPDAVAKRILDDRMKPLFREGRFAEGIEAALIDVSQLTEIDASGIQAPVVRQSNSSTSSRSGDGNIKLILFAFLFLGGLGVMRAASVIGGGALGFGAGYFLRFISPTLGAVGGGIIGLILALIFFPNSRSSLFSSRRRGGWWGGGGGFGGGGFGGGGGSWGGGGGGFGGGGSSSSW